METDVAASVQSFAKLSAVFHTLALIFAAVMNVGGIGRKFTYCHLAGGHPFTHLIPANDMAAEKRRLLVTPTCMVLSWKGHLLPHVWDAAS